MHHIETAYILAGGQSSRFGKNKALVQLDGEPLVVRIATQMRSQGVGVKLVAQFKTDYEHLKIPTIEDGISNAGPLAGVQAALLDCHHSGEEWCIIVSCDILEWRAEWLPLLLRCLELRPEVDAIIFDRNSFCPFPGLYRSQLWQIAKQVFDGGARSMRSFYQAMEPRVEICKIPEELFPRTFNSPAELNSHLSGKLL